MKLAMPRPAAVCLLGAAIFAVAAEALTLREPSNGDLLQLPSLLGGLGPDGGVEAQAEMMEQMLLSGGGSSPELAKMVLDMTKQLADHVMRQHNASVKALKDSVESVKKCRQGPTEEMSWPAAPAEEKIYVERNEAFHKCLPKKKFAQVRLKGCMSEMKLTEDLIVMKCKPLKELPENLMTCSFNDQTDQPALFYKQMAEYWTEKYNGILKTKGECTKLNQEINHYKTVNCGKKSQTLANITNVCSRLSERRQLAACSWKQGMDQQCQLYDRCFNTTIAHHKELEATTSKEVSGRKTSWRVVKRLGCLLDAQDLATNKVDKAKLDACAKAPVYNTDHLNIAVPELPIPNICKAKLPKSAGKNTAANCPS